MTAGLRNILRGCLLAFLATFAGCFLFFTLPDLVASKINKQLPYWFYANEVSFFVPNRHNGILEYHVAGANLVCSIASAINKHITVILLVA